MNISAAGSGSLQGSQVASANAALGKSEFLGLLVTQLANQDPLNPLDNQQFAAQLAQFSSLEEMSNIRQTLEAGLQTDQELAAALQGSLAAGLVGQRVTVLDDRVRLAGEPVTLRWEADGAPARVTVQVLDAAGQMVRSLTAPDPAQTSLSWDGRDAQGRRLPDGTYTLRVSAVDAAGAALAARPLWQGRVETVRFREGVPWLVGGGLEFSLAQVSEVGSAADGSAADGGGATGADVLNDLLGAARPHVNGL
jgi:flagellar basal-body rod modification protein FlgD